MASEFVQLAYPYRPGKDRIAGWYLSEKLDGQRAVWDGGISRGVLKCDVPYANTAKDGRYKVEEVATGLWSRYGNVIHAPDWWLDLLPKMWLDGELYWKVDASKRLLRQDLRSITARLSSNMDAVDWEQIVYRTFDIPCIDVLLCPRVLKSVNFNKTITTEAERWAKSRCAEQGIEDVGRLTYAAVYTLLMQKSSGVAVPLTQVDLPRNEEDAQNLAQKILDDIVADGGEGVMIRNPNAYYQTQRTHNLMKLKKCDDAEGMVVGYVAGRETDKGSKLRGKIGALILEITTQHGTLRRMELSGLNDAERELEPEASTWAWEHPGQPLPKDCEGVMIRKGDLVTFRFRGWSKDGIPQEARYWRKRIE